MPLTKKTLQSTHNASSSYNKPKPNIDNQPICST